MPLYSHSFSQDIYTNDKDESFNPKTDYPTSLYQSIIALPEDEKLEISKDVLGYDKETARINIETEMFPYEVIEKAKEYDTCDIHVPVKMYLNEDHFVYIYDES